MNIKILVADGDKRIRNSLDTLLTSEGYDTDLVVDGISVIKHFRRYDYHLVIMDMNLPELDGKNVCRQMQKISKVPFVIISTDASEASVLQAYALGAEDYILKPFSPKELLARLWVVLRRITGNENQTKRKLSFGELQIDTIAHSVFVSNKKASLTPKEYNLLVTLAKNPDQVFSREMLLNMIWGNDYYGTDRTVDTHIKTLREALKPNQEYISTVRGYGYKFNEIADLQKK